MSQGEWILYDSGYKFFMIVSQRQEILNTPEPLYNMFLYVTGIRVGPQFKTPFPI